MCVIYCVFFFYIFTALTVGNLVKSPAQTLVLNGCIIYEAAGVDAGTAGNKDGW